MRPPLGFSCVRLAPDQGQGRATAEVVDNMHCILKRYITRTPSREAAAAASVAASLHSPVSGFILWLTLPEGL